ncbi:MAG TPA: 2-phospho-L-lactate transferase CofD family protein, partial [Acidimicrobiales bacterium]
LAETAGSFIAAIEEAGRLLDAQGRVLPATASSVVLTAAAGDRRLSGQKAIEDSGGPVDAVGIDPPGADAPPEVLRAIADADQVVLGPGSLFTSVLAVAVVPGIRSALAARDGGVVFVCNLRPSKETVGFDVAAHVDALARHGVAPDVVLADPATMDVGRVHGPRVVTAALAQPNGWSHDAERLASALSELAG